MSSEVRNFFSKISKSCCLFFFVRMKYYFSILLGFINTSFYPDGEDSGLLNGSNRSARIPTHPFQPIRWKQNERVI